MSAPTHGEMWDLTIGLLLEEFADQQARIRCAQVEEPTPEDMRELAREIDEDDRRAWL